MYRRKRFAVPCVLPYVLTRQHGRTFVAQGQRIFQELDDLGLVFTLSSRSAHVVLWELIARDRRPQEVTLRG
jgi:hypothetical protein